MNPDAEDVGNTSTSHLTALPMMPHFKGVVVGTLGRVFDMLRRHSLHPDYIKMFVLDEADKMLSRSFKDQIYDIFQLLPSKILVGVFSATMPLEALEITRNFMSKPVRILVKRDELTLEGIKQFNAIC